MYSSSNRSSITVKKYGDHVSVSVVCRNNNSYQVIFYVEKNKKTVSLRKNETEAHRIAKAIAYDLDTGNLTLDDFKPLSGKEILALYQREKSKSKLTLIESVKNSTDNRSLKDIWENYKLIAVEKIAKTTFKSEFPKVDTLLDKLTEKELLLCNLNHLGKACLRHYSLTTVQRLLSYLQSALNVVINKKSLGNKKPLPNDFNLVHQLPKQQKDKTIKKFYKPEDINLILDYFVKDEDHKFYLPFTLFCALTGCRPSEAIALKTSDIKINQHKVQVLINKAYSNGLLNNHTKNYRVRLIPLNPKLAKFMIDYCKDKGKDSLVFPSIEGKYLDHHNYSARHYKPIVKKLVSEGKLREYLSPYHLRHSFATNMLRQGVDIATVSGLIGDNIQTVITHYIGSDYENADLPDIY